MVKTIPSKNRGSCDNFNGDKTNGRFQASLGSWRSLDRRLGRTMSCIQNRRLYTYSDNSSTTHDNRGQFINRKFTKMGNNVLKPSGAVLNKDSTCK